MKTVVKNDNVADSIGMLIDVPAEIKIEKSERFGPFWIASAGIVYKNASADEKTMSKKGYGVSRCSRSDKFNLVRGKQIAEGRAKKALLLKINKEKNHSIYMG